MSKSVKEQSELNSDTLDSHANLETLFPLEPSSKVNLTQVYSVNFKAKPAAPLTWHLGP